MRDHFDLDDSIIYLNSGTHSIAPRAVLEAVTSYQRRYELNPTAGLLTAWGHVWEAQQAIARFVGARADDLFLRSNVTEALNAFILGMPLPSGGGEILVSDLEYGAIVNTCRFRCERDGLQLKQFHVPLEADAGGLVAALLAAVTPKTRLVVVSHIASGTGTVFPIGDLSRELRARGVLLAVDGAHGPGALPLDLSRLDDLDFYGGNLHKWFMGPKGTAFGWVSPRHQDLIQPLLAGWPTFECPDFSDGFNHSSRFAQKMVPLGCHDFAPFVALREAAAFWDTHGAEKMRARIAALVACVEREMAALGWSLLSPASGPLRGPMLTYALPPGLAGEGAQFLTRVLREQRLQISSPVVQGRPSVRLSPHVHNDEGQIREAVRRLRLVGALGKN
ncbi:MAG: aminotransferase class V-fold PLP-dependent enzyme [Deltaproteobacteria bacterium]|nr:aminotransferase class V-fold PLP-dependent enzyme [Deltaproteobacteria bacterium]